MDAVNNTKRICWWDNIKFVMIVLVVAGHFADTLVAHSGLMKSFYLFIYAFHMPVFLFISGMFYKPERIGRKMMFYIISGFLLKIVTYIAQYAAGGKPEFTLLSEMGAPWFMFCMAFYIGIAYILRNSDKRPVIVITMVLAAFTGYDKNIGDFLCISRTLVFLPFFLLGTVIKPDKIAGFRRRNAGWLIPLGMIILAAWGYLCFGQREHFYILRHLFTGRNAFYKDIYDYGFVARMVCYIISICTGFAAIMVIPTGRIPGISYMGRNTINVYFWHWPLIMGADTLLKFGNLCNTDIRKMIFMATSVMLTVVLSTKIFEFPMKQLREAIDRKSTGEKNTQQR